MKNIVDDITLMVLARGWRRSLAFFLEADGFVQQGQRCALAVVHRFVIGLYRKKNIIARSLASLVHGMSTSVYNWTAVHMYMFGANAKVATFKKKLSGIHSLLHWLFRQRMTDGKLRQST